MNMKRRKKTEKIEEFKPYYLPDFSDQQSREEQTRAVNRVAGELLLARRRAEWQEEKGAHKSKNRLVNKDSNGDYFYNGKIIANVTPGTISYNVFDILYLKSGQSGFLSYEAIDKELIKRGHAPTKDEKVRNKRIQNAILNKNQGIFRYAKIGDNRLRNETLDKQKKLVEFVRGNGLQFNNPILNS